MAQPGSHEGKGIMVLIGIDSRHWSRVGLINKLRSMVRFIQNPKPLTYKRPSQIKLFKKKVGKKYDSDSKDDMVPNSENNKPQLVLVHHLRF